MMANMQQNWIPVVAACVAACAAIVASVVASRTAFVLHKRTQAFDREERARKERAEVRKGWAPFLAKVDAFALATEAYSVAGTRPRIQVPGTGTNLPDPLGKGMSELTEAGALGELVGPRELVKRAEELRFACIDMADAALSVAWFRGTSDLSSDEPGSPLEKFQMAEGRFDRKQAAFWSSRRLFVEAFETLVIESG